MIIDDILERSAFAFEEIARKTQESGYSIENHSLIMASSVNAGLVLSFMRSA